MSTVASTFFTVVVVEGDIYMAQEKEFYFMVLFLPLRLLAKLAHRLLLPTGCPLSTFTQVSGHARSPLVLQQEFEVLLIVPRLAAADMLPVLAHRLVIAAEPRLNPKACPVSGSGG